MDLIRPCRLPVAAELVKAITSTVAAMRRMDGLIICRGLLRVHGPETNDLEVPKLQGKSSFAQTLF